MGKTIITNGHFYGLPNVTSVLCENGRILSITPDISRTYNNTIDLKGGWAYPGFIDGHMHLTGLGWSLETLDLVGTHSKKSILSIIEKATLKTPTGHWIQGRGWDQNDWQNASYPTAKDLDSVSSEHPVVLRRIDGHALWANTRAMEIAGISIKIIEPKGGNILYDELNKPTGVFIDNAMTLITDYIPKSTENDKYRQITKAQTLLNSLGITSVHDAGTGVKDIRAIKQLIKENNLSVRVFAMLNDTPEDYEPFLEKGPITHTPFLTVRTLKVYMDGALGSRGAALLAPYSDDQHQSGLLFMNKDELAAIVQTFNSAGFQVNTHGIGDRAIRIILDAYEESGMKEMRNRIEHAQIVHPIDLKRFKKLGVIPAMQATHCTSDMPWIGERLGVERLSRAYPWQSFAQLGNPIPGGSDAPVEFPDPLAGIYAAITRQDSLGWPDGGWQQQERLTLKQAVQMYTEWPAYASFEENNKGKIDVGYYADFTVLDRQLSDENPKMILDTKVIQTIVNGKIVYQSYNETK
ncbi:MAG: amidohydrolase [Candidatus Marinimicrobia bacterium]|nr:amidohydrolase [Candidatus Neomarinimicrobiota bacterium]